MSKPRITAAKLQRLSRVTTALIAGVVDARYRYKDLNALKPRKLAPLSKKLRQLLNQSHAQDFSESEVELKRLVVRARLRAFGTPQAYTFSLTSQLPGAYQDLLTEFDVESRAILKALADVPATS